MDALTSAKNFATRLHVMENRQWYGNVVPHTHHLADVERVLLRFGWTHMPLRVASWLHDIVEDTRGKDNEVKSRDIEELYGEEVGGLVEAVTDEDGPNRKARKALTYPKTRAAGIHAIALKLADRIANVEFGIESGSGHLKMYKKEYPDFRHGLFVWPEGFGFTWEENHLRAMWDHLDKLHDFNQPDNRLVKEDARA